MCDVWIHEWDTLINVMMLQVYLPQYTVYLIICLKSSMHFCHYCTSSVLTDLFHYFIVIRACLKQTWLISEDFHHIKIYFSFSLYDERCLDCLSDTFICLWCIVSNYNVNLQSFENWKDRKSEKSKINLFQILQVCTIDYISQLGKQSAGIFRKEN